MASFPFRCIAFDLDGTIVDSAPDLAVALNVALVQLGRAPLPLDRVRAMIGHGTPALLRRGLEATGGSDDALVARGLPMLMDHYHAHICDLSLPYPGVEQAMDALAALGVTLALCTNKPERAARQLVEALGWGARFATIVGGDTLAVAKPDPAPLLLAIEQAGGGTAALIGDSIVDMQTARAAGVPGIAVSFGYADRPVAELGAAAVISHFDALVTTLEQLTRSG